MLYLCQHFRNFLEVNEFYMPFWIDLSFLLAGYFLSKCPLVDSFKVDGFMNINVKRRLETLPVSISLSFYVVYYDKLRICIRLVYVRLFGQVCLCVYLYFQPTVYFIQYDKLRICIWVSLCKAFWTSLFKCLSLYFQPTVYFIQYAV